MYKMKCLKKHVQLERYEITSITQNSDKFLKIKINNFYILLKRKYSKIYIYSVLIKHTRNVQSILQRKYFANIWENKISPNKYNKTLKFPTIGYSCLYGLWQPFVSFCQF